MVGVAEQAAVTRGAPLVFAGAADDLGPCQEQDRLEVLWMREALEVARPARDDVVHDEEAAPRGAVCPARGVGCDDSEVVGVAAEVQLQPEQQGRPEAGQALADLEVGERQHRVARRPCAARAGADGDRTVVRGYRCVLGMTPGARRARLPRAALSRTPCTTPQ